MSGHIAVLSQEPLVACKNCSIQCLLSSSGRSGRVGPRQQQSRSAFEISCSPVRFSRGRQIFVLRCRVLGKGQGRHFSQRIDAAKGSRVPRRASSSLASLKRLEGEDSSGKLVCSSSSTGDSLGLPYESSTSDVTPSTSDSDEGAPMRKFIVLAFQRIFRLLRRVLKMVSPVPVLKGTLNFMQARWRQVLLFSILGSTFGMGYLCTKLTGNSSPRLVAYSDLIDHLQSRTVTSALFEEGSTNIYFNVKDENDATLLISNEDNELDLLENAATGGTVLAQVAHTNNIMSGVSNSIKRSSPQWHYTTRRIRNDETFLLQSMRDAGVKYSSAPQSMSASLKAVLITVITLWIPLSPLLWLLHRQLSQNNSSATRRRRNLSRPVKFEDVAGVDVAKAELMEIVSCLKGASQFTSLGAKLPRGVLLVGPPGTGKTLLARAVAGEAGVPFFAASASEFVEMFVGRGAARIRELFAEARKNTPSIIFVDELDAVGGRRGRSFNDERDQTLNQLLTEMDGFEGDTGVLVLAATNRPEALDPALCRPGRLSRRVHVTEPDQLGRQQVLSVHMRGVPVVEDRDMLERVVASMTPGFVGADLANLVNESALLAARKGRSAVSMEDFKEALERVKYGVGERRRTVFDEVEQKLGSWFSKTWSDTHPYPSLPAGG